MELEIKLQPLSVNKSWAGRRFKSHHYKSFEVDVARLLPMARSTVKGWVEVHYTFYIKNYKMTDVDNLIKPIQDILVKRKYIEDDRKIIWLSAEKVEVKNNVDEKISIIIQKYEV